MTRPYPSSNPNSLITRLYYGPCDERTEIIADSVRTGGHEWPMNTSDRINNSEETWAFLKKFSLTQTAVLPGHTITSPHDGITISYSSGNIHFKGVKEKCQVRVVDTRGRLVSSAAVSQRQIVFNNKPSGVYVVMVSGNNRSVALKMMIP